MRASRCAARAGAAEHPLEGHARVDLHRQRRGFAGPGDRVHVGAAVARHAAADVAGEVLGGELERRERRVLADLLRQHLVDGDAEPDVLGLGLLGHHAAQPARRADRVIGGGQPAGARQVADHVHLRAERLERREDRRDLQRRPPTAWASSEASWRRWGSTRRRTAAAASPASGPGPSRPAPSTRETAARPRPPCRGGTVRRGSDFLVMNMMRSLTIVRPFRLGLPHRERLRFRRSRRRWLKSDSPSPRASRVIRRTTGMSWCCRPRPSA